MNKNLKSLHQLALPLLVFALCVAVQQSDSAVSAVLLLSVPRVSPTFLFLHLLRAIRYEHEEPQGDSLPAKHHRLSPAQVYK